MAVSDRLQMLQRLFIRSCTRLTSTAALARSNSSSSDWCLESRVLPQRCSFVRRACHTHIRLIVWTFMQKKKTIYAPVLDAHIHILQINPTHIHTWRRGGRGECAGSASSAFSGRMKPFDMLGEDGKNHFSKHYPDPSKPRFSSEQHATYLLCPSFSPEPGRSLCTFTCSNTTVSTAFTLQIYTEAEADCRYMQYLNRFTLHLWR